MAPSQEVATKDLVAFAGVSFRRIDYWTRTGLLRTTRPCVGSGDPRFYAASELRVAWAIARVQEAAGTARDLAFLAPVLDDIRSADGGLLVLAAAGAVVVEGVADLIAALDILGPAVSMIDLNACPAFKREDVAA